MAARPLARPSVETYKLPQFAEDVIDTLERIIDCKDDALRQIIQQLYRATHTTDVNRAREIAERALKGEF